MLTCRGCWLRPGLVLALALLTAGPAPAMTSPNYTIPWDVLAAAGGASASPGHAVSATVGQPTPPGQGSSPGYRLAGGFWTGDTSDILGSLALGGAPAVGTKVKLNLGRTLAGQTTTDAAGEYRFDQLTPGSYKITIGTFRSTQTTSVSGTLLVKGVPPTGIKVKLKNLDTAQILRKPIDAAGGFSFANVAPGRYKITIANLPVP